jgi:hypothetical protein
MTYEEMLRSGGAKERLVITATGALFSILTGNMNVMYDIGNLKMLSNVGVNH